MLTWKLKDNWSMKEANALKWVPATVPGSVYQDYLNNGLMEDPYYRDNELQALELMEHDFIYRTVFDVEETLLQCAHTLLHFDGIDTLADITLNGTLLGHADNMHRVWEYDVKQLLHEKNNELRVILYSPVNFVREMDKQDPDIAMSVDAMRGASYLRKAHGMFGWDWGPRLPDAGIWKEVSLFGVEEARISDVCISQKHEENRVDLALEIRLETFDEIRSEDYLIKVTAVDPSGKTCAETEQELGKRVDLRISNPQLWWPNGYGPQNLYHITVELCQGDRVLDSWTRRIGLRTIRLVQEKDQWGVSFCHEVNGVRIFAMGADYIPNDNILPKVTPERTRQLLSDARDCNFNCMRVWGGGCYADDVFLDCCDEFGILVWQDFLFACATYDLTEEFEANIRAEFRDNIRRMRHHACLGLWCGNNEMESFIASHREEWCIKPKQFSDYINMYEYIIPRMLKELDPATPYIPSSPTSGGAFDDPDDDNRGDRHYWDVWHGGKPITEYRKFFFRYLSEFGFNSMPDLKTIESFTTPEDRNFFSYVMEKHQRCVNGNGTIMRYLQQSYQLPSTFERQVYASQMLQAEAMRYGVEHLRANRGRCMGAIIWQFNDIWPCASWAMIDYAGRWKAVWYAAKRFFAPLTLVCEEDSRLFQNPNINAEPYPVRNAVHFAVLNERMESAEVCVCWEVRNADGSLSKDFDIHMENVTAEPLSATWLTEKVLENLDPFTQYVSYHMTEAGSGELLAEGCVLLIQPKYFRFADPKVQVEVVDETTILVQAEAMAKGVEVYSETADLKLSDNFFDMNPGSRKLQILSGNAEALKVRSLFDIC